MLPLAQDYVFVKTQADQVRELLASGLSNAAIVKLVGCTPVYLRAVRSRLKLAIPGYVPQPGRPRTAERAKRAIRAPSPPRFKYPRQSNLRELAVKLYVMRQEGRL